MTQATIRERLHALWLRLRSLGKRRQLEQDLDEELAFHLEMRETRNRADGIAPETARNAARKQFGNVVKIRENSYEMWTFFRAETWWQDIRYGARLLRKNTGFTIASRL